MLFGRANGSCGFVRLDCESENRPIHDCLDPLLVGGICGDPLILRARGQCGASSCPGLFIAIAGNIVFLGIVILVLRGRRFRVEIALGLLDG